MSKPSNSPFAGKKPAPVKASAAVPPPPPSAAAAQRQPLNPVVLSEQEQQVIDEQANAMLAATQDRPVSRDGARIPFGMTTSRFPELPPRDGYHRRWINDVRDRIALALRAGYTHVLKDDGTNHSVPGGFYGGQAMSIYAMEMPMEFREQDIDALQDRLDAVDQLIYRGKYKAERDDKFYVPDSTPMNVRVQTGSGRG
jgi:hypothetical protein